MSNISVEILHSKSLKPLANVEVSSSATVGDVKKAFEAKKSYLYPSRQMFKLEAVGKGLRDEEKLADLKPNATSIKLFFKDLGPQVGWTTVFLTEYAGPLIIYVIFYLRPAFIYGPRPSTKYHDVVHYACGAWVFHYAKRLLETIFVHRFSNATMPIANIFKNSIYYWGFAAYIAYYINHPLYTPASFGQTQIYLGLAGFIFNELGNFSVHVALRNLRPPGSKARKIPLPTSNPYTILFNFVSCPNYTYEIGSWIFFTIMVQSVPALLFTLAGGYQMTVWAMGKHRNYRKEFEKYPRSRKSIIPFLV